MTVLVTLTSKNQLTLPVDLVRLMDLSKGSKLIAKVDEKTITLEKIDPELRSLQGILAHTPIGKKLSLEEVVKKAEKKEAMRLAKK